MCVRKNYVMHVSCFAKSFWCLEMQLLELFVVLCTDQYRKKFMVMKFRSGESEKKAGWQPASASNYVFFSLGDNT